MFIYRFTKIVSLAVFCDYTSDVTYNKLVILRRLWL